METTFRIQYADREGPPPSLYDSAFEKLSDMLCRECGGSCQGFFLTHNIAEYQAHSGPKIGWAVDGHTIFLRMANCKDVNRIERISEFLKLFGMRVAESRMIQ